MKSFSIILMAALLLGCIPETSAQGKSESPDGQQQLTANYFDFYLINGYALGYKFSANENSAFRLQLDFSRNFTDENSDATSFITQIGSTSSTQTQNSTGDSKLSNIGISLFFQYIHNIYTSTKGHAYIGAGPFLSYNNKTVESANNYTNVSSQTYSSIQSSYGSERTTAIGAGLIIGIEGYLSKNITVFAETQLAGGRIWKKIESKNTTAYSTTNPQTAGNSTKSNNRGWYYNLTNIRIGMGISI